MTMIEKVAIAIEANEGMCPETIARAAIEAMREPSAAMLEVMDGFEMYASGYRAMIDAALKE